MKEKENNWQNQTKYFDYYPQWLERFIESEFPHLVRKKYKPPYIKLWEKVAKKRTKRRQRKK